MMLIFIILFFYFFIFKKAVYIYMEKCWSQNKVFLFFLDRKHVSGVFVFAAGFGRGEIIN